MLDFNQPRHFSLPEVQTIFRALFTHLKAPDVYQSEGIFRIPGTHQWIVHITDDILAGKSFIHPEYKVHDYIGALKYALMNCVLNKDDKLIVELKANIKNGDETADIEAIKSFVYKLVNAKEKAKYAAGEVIYDYLHYLTRVAEFAVKNHMDEVNLGKMVGPLFANLIEEDPKALLNTIQTANALCTRLIREKYFQAPFNETYRHQFERARKMQLAELETQRNELLELGKDFNARLTVSYDDLNRDQKELQVRNQKLFHLISKKTKRLAEVVTNKKQGLQRLIGDDKGNGLKIKQLDAQIRQIQEELLPKPGKLLKFSRPSEVEQEGQAVNTPIVNPAEALKTKSHRRKHAK